MAASLEVFRESMVQSKTLAAEQDKDRAAKAERTQRIETRIADFEETVRSALDNADDVGRRHAEHPCRSHDQQRRPLLLARKRRGGCCGRDLRQRADGVVGHGRAVILDRERTAVRSPPPPGSPTRRSARPAPPTSHHAGAWPTPLPASPPGRPDPDHRLTDEPAGAERHDRGGAGRRERPRLCCGRVRSEEPGGPDGEGHRRDPLADRLDAGRDDHAVGANPPHRPDDCRDQRGDDSDCGAVEEQGAATREISPATYQQAASGTTEVSSNIVGVSQPRRKPAHRPPNVLTRSAGLRKEAETLRQRSTRSCPRSELPETWHLQAKGRRKAAFLYDCNHINPSM